MYRLAASVLFSLLAAAVLAAPPPKPKTGPWFDGWHKSVDPKGDCRFDREGEKLTITVPGEGHDLDVLRARLNAPHMLRQVEGDFLVQVRVGGNFWPKAPRCRRQAGLALLDGEDFKLTLTAGVGSFPSEGGQLMDVPMFSVWTHFRPRSERYIGETSLPVYLRLERRRDEVKVSLSPDGTTWEGGVPAQTTRLPKKVKVGVVAEASDPGTFKAEFDEFKLTPLGGSGKRGGRPAGGPP